MGLELIQWAIVTELDAREWLRYRERVTNDYDDHDVPRACV